MNAVVTALPPGEAIRFQAFNSKAVKHVQDGNPGAAIAVLEEALSIAEDAAVLGNYGDALARCGRVQDAKRAFERSLELKPDYAQSHYNLGVMHDQLDDYEASRQHYLNAIECRVTPAALNNLANAETFTLRLADAEHHYRQAIKHGWFDAIWNLSLCLMMQGKWQEGWEFYEQRPQMRDYRSHPLLWRGESLAGKSLLILTEQGLGDSIFALRYVAGLREQGVRVTIGCEPTLIRLVQSSFPASDSLPPVKVLDRTTQQPNEPVDYVTLSMSLPGYLSPDGTGPAAPYLAARPVRMEGFNVGLCWNGSTVVGPPKERNIALKLLAPLAEIEGVRLVSLQRGNAVDELADCGFEVHDAMAGVHDVYDTACVVASLDLVITVDTLIPHLAGALGKPVWLLNRFMSCWQWGTPAYDPHLYATIAQFRQPRRGDWASVVEHVKFGLAHVASQLPKEEAR